MTTAERELYDAVEEYISTTYNNAAQDQAVGGRVRDDDLPPPPGKLVPCPEADAQQAAGGRAVLPDR